jgi:hypothetical protein
MHIAYAPDLLRCLAPEFIPQQTVHAHLRLALYLPCLLQRNVQHLLRLSDLIDNTIFQRTLARPSVGFQQHLARDLWPQLKTWQVPDTREVQTEVHRRHTEKAAARVHDAVIVGESERAGAAESVACEKCNGGERII